MIKKIIKVVVKRNYAFSKITIIKMFSLQKFTSDEYNFNNNQLILEKLIRAMPQLTERNQLM